MERNWDMKKIKKLLFNNFYFLIGDEKEDGFNLVERIYDKLD